jgi:hypothetical protein
MLLLESGNQAKHNISTGQTGPIEPYVLADLYAWLEAHSGLSHPYVTTPTYNEINQPANQSSHFRTSTDKGEGNLFPRKQLLF